MRFEWDPNKAASNLRKHRVSFDEACAVFEDPRRLVQPDKHHAERLNVLGASAGRTLFVVYVEKDDDETYRIISARPASRRERTAYLAP